MVKYARMQAKTTDNQKQEETIDYEQVMGEWVTARCRKRAAAPISKEMPPEVKRWLKYGGNSPPGATTVATQQILGWLIKTIEKPDWDEMS